MNHNEQKGQGVEPPARQQPTCCGDQGSRVRQSTETSDVRQAVREHYGKAAAQHEATRTGSCCGGSRSSHVQDIYETPDAFDLPEEISGFSLGCGDPITLAALQPGNTVLDLGSGGGLDCFLAARRVGESGHVIGVDMTAEMIEKARQNNLRMGFSNVEFRLGEIEHIPVGDNSVDVIISNCVINLSPDKPQVLREAYRVLKPGGRLAVSDIVTDGPLPRELQDSLRAWAGCVAGALDMREFHRLLETAGFVDIKITPQYWDGTAMAEMVEQMVSAETGQTSGCCAPPTGWGTGGALLEKAGFTSKELSKRIFSARISAAKPG